MTAIRKYIPYMEWWNDDIAKVSITEFCKNLETICLEGGLVKSNIPNNMDTNNIIIPSISNRKSSATYVFISTPLSFDMNDTLQSQLPIRISFEFGFCSLSDSSASNVEYFPIIPFVKTTISIVNASYSKTFINNYTYLSTTMYANNSSNYFKPYVQTKKYESHICVKDGFVCLNICPSVTYSSNNVAYNDSIIFFIIERSFDVNGYTSDNINVISPNNNGTDIPQSSSNIACTVLSNRMSYNTSSTFNYFPLPYNMTNGYLHTYPFYHMNSDYTLYQSKNIIIIPDKTLLCNQLVSASIESNNYTYIVENNESTSQYPVSESTFLTRFE